MRLPIAAERFSRPRRSIRDLGLSPPATCDTVEFPIRYRRRRPERTCLYRAVLGHLETYLALAREGQGEGVPRHVEAEFRCYLECGWFHLAFEKVHGQGSLPRGA